MAKKTLYITGPMHPDLFDGETPMMRPVQVDESVRLFRVDIDYAKVERKQFFVLSSDISDAEDIGEALFLKQDIIHDEIRAVVGTESSPEWVPMTEEMLEAYLAYEDAA